MDTWIRNLSLEEKGWEGGKTKATCDGWNKRRWEKHRIDLADVEKWSDPLEEKHTGWKGLTLQSRWSRRIGIHIGVWEHHLRKVWNQHLTLEQLEYLKQNKNKGLACRISRNKHMIEISSEVFVVGPTRADRTAPSCTRQCTWHTKRPRVSIAKDSLRHNKTTVKTTVDRRTTRRRTPISYHASAGKIS